MKLSQKLLKWILLKSFSYACFSKLLKAVELKSTKNFLVMTALGNAINK